MAVPSPRTWEQSELANATMLNSQIRDAIRFFFANGVRPFTILTRTAGTVNLTSGSLTPVTWNNFLVDDDNMWPGSSDNRLVIRTPGLYDIRGQYFALGNTAGGNQGVRVVTINRIVGGEGSPVVLSRSGAAASWCEPDGVGGTWIVDSQPMDTVCRTQVYQSLDAGDELEMQIYQNSGSAIPTVYSGTTGLQTYFSARWIAAN